MYVLDRENIWIYFEAEEPWEGGLRNPVCWEGRETGEYFQRQPDKEFAIVRAQVQ